MKGQLKASAALSPVPVEKRLGATWADPDAMEKRQLHVFPCRISNQGLSFVPPLA